MCLNRGLRLTEQRELVLRIVWQSHKPLGAYALIHQLSEQLERSVAPPTVYRALDFLAEQRLIHRIHSLNAFVGCPEPGTHHQNHFLICRHCGQAEECSSNLLKQVINKAAAAANFEAHDQSLEIIGLCSMCQNQAQPPASQAPL